VTRKVLNTRLITILALAGAGCGDQARRPEPTPAPVAEALAEVVPDPPVAFPEAPISSQGAVSSEGTANKFKSWGVVHSFLGATVVMGEVLSATEAIALTRDNHVGVTTDGGATWGFIRHVNGVVYAVGGVAGGPYVVVGKAGYLATSSDGKNWRDLPRYTDLDLFAVALGDGNFTAIGKKGIWVTFDKAGTKGAADFMPDKFAPSAIMVQDGKFLAWSGKKGYVSADGRAWAMAIELPAFVDKKKGVPTSKGLCKLAKVGKNGGVACEVAGIGFGLGDSAAFVDQKGAVAFTKDGGKNWTVTALPFKDLMNVIGPSAGPYYALGKKGMLARSKDDAKTWQTVNINTTKNLNGGIVDGGNILIVGDGGTIVHSADGGESWQVQPPPSGGSYKMVLKQDGKYRIPDGKKAIESADGAQWTEVLDPNVLASIPPAGKPGVCDTRLPIAGETCKFLSKVTTPLGLPNVRGFDFAGDVGLGYGDAGLVTFTTDGGATWKVQSGYQLGWVSAFDLKATTIVAVGRASIVASTDGGVGYHEAQLPKGIGAIWTAKIAGDGSVYAAGAKGTILKAEGKLHNWVPLFTWPKNGQAYSRLFEVDGVLYAADIKGGLARSDDRGAHWSPIATGVTDAIQNMAGEGSTVLAVTKAGRKGSNYLLRSDDNGSHFYVQREISDNDSVPDFGFEGGKVSYNNRISGDFGATWTRKGEVYWSGTVDIQDGSNLRLAHFTRYDSKDEIYLVGSTEGDWTLIDSFYGEGAYFKCEQGTGCWMMAGGQIYRPL
jgi:photosystem II stability/assembly factor-like uncharacterized protein